MGSLVNFNPPDTQSSRVACVYCSTYRALVAFMDTDVKWFDAIQLQVSLAKMDCNLLIAQWIVTLGISCCTWHSTYTLHKKWLATL